MPRAVSGFTKHEAPSAGVVPSGKTRHWLGLDAAELRVHGAAENRHRPAHQRPGFGRRNRHAPPRPRLRCRPATTGPCARRCPRNMAGGMLAVTTGLSGEPETFAVDTSAPPNISPRSEGLMGDASTRTTTSSAASAPAIGTLVSESSRMPSFGRSSAAGVRWLDRSCAPLSSGRPDFNVERHCPSTSEQMRASPEWSRRTACAPPRGVPRPSSFARARRARRCRALDQSRTDERLEQLLGDQSVAKHARMRIRIRNMQRARVEVVVLQVPEHPIFRVDDQITLRGTPLLDGHSRRVVTLRLCRIRLRRVPIEQDDRGNPILAG